MPVKKVRKTVSKNSILQTSSSGLPKWRQSPIDLTKTATWSKKFPPLYLTNYWSQDGTATVTNTGKTVTVELSDRTLPSMRGGPLNEDEFQFMNVQFRWGPENSLGAEHSIDGIWYSMEAQIMHWNIRYGSIEKCFDKSDGIAILSYLMQVVGCPGMPDNPSLAPIVDNLPKIKKMGTSTTIPPNCLLWMLDSCAYHGYYTYPGSLTTFPYSECVVWIIPTTITKISVRQIDAFRNLYDDKWENILGNCRQQQRLHRRRILFASDKALAMSEYTGLIGLPTTGQSPINIDDRLVRTRRYSPLVLTGHWLNDGEARLFNSGNTAKVFLTGDRIPSTVAGGPLANDVYELTEVHFHWGQDDCRGAEHTINNTWYSMEGHALHWNRKYSTPEECFRHKDGYCILAYLFLVQPGCCDCINPQLERITDYLKHIRDPYMETNVAPNCLSWMRWATFSDRYYIYAGSYNSGEYPECATWIVFPVVIPIRSNQIDEFRKLRNKDGDNIESNWREIQLLKCRQIYLAVNH
ncbi:Carbonic anhydrase 2, partial [Anthophora retusa]